MITLIATAALAPAQTVHRFYGPMVTGVAVSKTGRVFVNFPRWGDPVANSVVEIVNGREVPYPNVAWNRNPTQPQNHFVCVQSVVTDPKDRLWVLDPAAIRMQDTRKGGPKLVRINLKTNKVERVYHFPESVAHPTSYLNDVRFDLTRGAQGYAFITDSSAKGPNGIVVLDLATGESWRRLNDHHSTKSEKITPIVEGQRLVKRKLAAPPDPVTVGSDGIAINVKQGRLYYCPLVSRKLYSVSLDALIDRDADDASTVRQEGTKGASDGMIMAADGTLFVTDYERNQVKRRNPNGSYTPVIQLPKKEWPDTLAIGPGGWLYVTANQLHRQKDYRVKDLRVKPYRLVRARVGASPQ